MVIRGRYLCRHGNRNAAKEITIRVHSMRDTVAATRVPRTTAAVVVGGGCMGTSIAWHLARRGLGVVLLEKSHVAAGATGHSGALVRQHYEARLGIRLAQASLAFFRQFEEETGFSCDFRTTGFLSGTRERDLPAFEALIDLLLSEGVRAERLTPSDAKTMEPQLEASDHAATRRLRRAPENPLRFLREHILAAGRGEGHVGGLHEHGPAEDDAETRVRGVASGGHGSRPTHEARDTVSSDERCATERGMGGCLRRDAGFVSDPGPGRPRWPLRRGRLQRSRIQALPGGRSPPRRVRGDGQAARAACAASRIAVRGEATGPRRRTVPRREEAADPLGPSRILRYFRRPSRRHYK